MVRSILGKKIFRGAHTRPQNAPKIPLKPPKMAILRPNLNDGVLPRDNGEVLLWQYTRVSSSSSQSTLPIEDIEHVLTQCVGTSDTRRAKLPVLLSLAATAKSNINLEKISNNTSILTQFLLDCTSFNLSNDTRISVCDPTADDIYREARHLINAIHCERIRRIKSMTKWHSMILLIVLQLYGINGNGVYIRHWFVVYGLDQILYYLVT